MHAELMNNMVGEWDPNEFALFIRELEGQFARIGSRGSSTPTPTAGSGAFGSASASVKWTLINGRVIYTVKVIITTNGTAAGHIVVPMPYAAESRTAAHGVDSAGITALTGWVSVGGSLFIYKYDGTYPGGTGKDLDISGSYQAVRLV